MFTVQTAALKIVIDLISGKTDPEISPGILFVCLVKGHFIWEDQKSISRLNGVLFVPGIVISFSSDAVVKQVVAPDSRPEGIKRCALLYAAEKEIKVRKHLVLDFQK